MKRGRFDDIMAAITFAQAGEHEKALEFLKGRKHVLLAVSSRTYDRNVFTYAFNICSRIGADLTILHLGKAEGTIDEIASFVREAGRRGITCAVVRREGCMKKAILSFTEERKDILFVIIGTALELDIECSVEGTELSESWKKLSCPLVVVSKGPLPSMG